MMKMYLKPIRSFLIAFPFFVALVYAIYAPDRRDKTIQKAAQVDTTHVATYVIDGDTVVLDGKLKVRYIGIDTPEKDEPFYNESKRLNASLVLNKKVKIEVCSDEPYDKYGRTLAFVYVEGNCVNTELIRQGMARTLTIPPCGVEKYEEYSKLQSEARARRLGLWADEEVIKPDNAKLFIGQTKSVRGNILKVYQSKKALFLNFGEDYRKDFTAVIFLKDLPRFKAFGIDPAVAYLGKNVIVRGEIKEYNGPQILLFLPSDIEIVN